MIVHVSGFEEFAWDDIVVYRFEQMPRLLDKTFYGGLRWLAL